MSEPQIKIEIVEGDVLEFSADVLALKYAQHYYGSDEAVAHRLVKRGAASEDELQPAPWKWVWIKPRGMPYSRVLFVGVPQLIKFGYTEIAAWARQVIVLCGREHPEAQHLAITLHGPGFGLDEVEALQAELRGIMDAVKAGEAPQALCVISIVERKPSRVERLKAVLSELSSNRREFGPAILVENASVELETPASPKKAGRPSREARPGRHDRLNEAGPPAGSSAVNLQTTEQVERKPRAFVAMPFAPEMEDVFYYGIQNPVRELGYICERVDQEAFTGDILDQVKMRIENAEIVIADLTGSNANVYLEVGYAWGKGRPTLLVANKKDDLKFDVRGQRCLKYQSIKDLENKLTTELKGLDANRKP